MSAVERTSPQPGVALLTLNRPEKLNAMTTELVQGLHAHFDDIAIDPEVRVVVLTGACIPHIRSLPQPVISAVNGAAAGGGFALVLGSDIRIAARSAKFNAAFIRIGLSACDIGTSWLPPRPVRAP